MSHLWHFAPARHGGGTCFHELHLSTKLSYVQEWSLWGGCGYDLVDLKFAENMCVVTPMNAYWSI